MTFEFFKSHEIKPTDAEWLVITDEYHSADESITEVLNDFIPSHENCVAVSLRITPTDTDVNYEPVTLKTAYIAKCAFAVKKDVFLAAGGFDEGLSVKKCYDLSLRLNTEGNIYYCPFAVAKQIKEISPRDEYVGEILDGTYLAYKYGDRNKINDAERNFQNALKNPKHFDGIRKILAKEYRTHLLKTSHFSKFRKQNSELFSKINRDFTSFEKAKRGTFTLTETDFSPYISVVIRTHERKELLRRTLMCMRNQIYTNFQIVVAEDGTNTAEEMVKTDFADMNIKYFATGENVGRGRAGNLGIENADGEYICFVDDDDYYYADYLLSFVSFLSRHRDCDMAICDGMRYETDIISKNPYVFTVGETYPIHFDRINLMDMCVRCRIPMPCGIFRKELYTKHGGMHESIGGDEDWYMWLKFLKTAKRADDSTPDIHRALTLFGYPADKEARAKREKVYAEYDRIMLSDENLVFTVTKETLTQWENAVKGDAMYLKNTNQADTYMATLNRLGCREIVCENDESKTLTAMQINNYYYYLMDNYLN